MSCIDDRPANEHNSFIYLDSKQKEVSRFSSEPDRHLILSFFPGFLGAYSKSDGTLLHSYSLDYSTFSKIGEKIINEHLTRKITIPDETNFQNNLQFQFVSKNDQVYYLAWLLKAIEKNNGEQHEIIFFVVTSLNNEFQLINHYLVVPPNQRFAGMSKWDQFDWSWGSKIINHTGYFVRDVEALTDKLPLYIEYDLNVDSAKTHRLSNLRYGSAEFKLLFGDVSNKDHSSDFGLILFEFQDSIYTVSNGRLVNFESFDVKTELPSLGFDFALIDKIRVTNSEEICLCGYVFENKKSAIGFAKFDQDGILIKSFLTEKAANMIQIISCDIVEKSLIILYKNNLSEYEIQSISL
jgi:hypothetical protein